MCPTERGHDQFLPQQRRAAHVSVGSFATLQPPGWRGSYALHRDQTGSLPICRKGLIASCRTEAQGVLFNHLVGGREQSRRDAEAERLGGLAIDHKLEFGRCLYR
jgi:hypothetical protein